MFFILNANFSSVALNRCEHMLVELPAQYLAICRQLCRSSCQICYCIFSFQLCNPDRIFPQFLPLLNVFHVARKVALFTAVEVQKPLLWRGQLETSPQDISSAFPCRANHPIGMYLDHERSCNRHKDLRYDDPEQKTGALGEV